MPRSHSVYVVKGSPSMKGHTSNTLLTLYSQSPFPFLITSVPVSLDHLHSLGICIMILQTRKQRTRDEVNWSHAVEKRFLSCPLSESHSLH